jgi:hypothetical protein
MSKIKINLKNPVKVGKLEESLFDVAKRLKLIVNRTERGYVEFNTDSGEFRKRYHSTKFIFSKYTFSLMDIDLYQKEGDLDDFSLYYGFGTGFGSEKLAYKFLKELKRSLEIKSQKDL